MRSAWSVLLQAAVVAPYAAGALADANGPAYPSATRRGGRTCDERFHSGAWEEDEEDAVVTLQTLQHGGIGATEGAAASLLQPSALELELEPPAPGGGGALEVPGADALSSGGADAGEVALANFEHLAAAPPPTGLRPGEGEELAALLTALPSGPAAGAEAAGAEAMGDSPLFAPTLLESSSGLATPGDVTAAMPSLDDALAPPGDALMLGADMSQAARLGLSVRALKNKTEEINKSLDDLAARQNRVRSSMPETLFDFARSKLGIRSASGVEADTILGARRRQAEYDTLFIAAGLIGVFFMCGCCSHGCTGRRKGKSLGFFGSPSAGSSSASRGGSPNAPSRTTSVGSGSPMEHASKLTDKGLKGAAKVVGRTARLANCCCSCHPEVLMKFWLFFAFWFLGVGMLWHLGMIQPFLKQIIVYGWVLVGALAIMMLWFTEMIYGIKSMVKKAFRTIDRVRAKMDKIMHSTPGGDHAKGGDDDDDDDDEDFELSSDSEQERSPRKPRLPRKEQLKPGWEWLTGSKTRAYQDL